MNELIQQGNDPQAIAIHEAAHAALFLLMGNARIVEVKVFDASCNPRGLCVAKYQEMSPHVLIAGYVAGMRAAKGKDWRPTPALLRGSLHIDEIEQAARMVGADGLMGLWLETVPMVDRAWGRIQALAAALLAAGGTLAGDAVHTVWDALSGTSSAPAKGLRRRAKSVGMDQRSVPFVHRSRRYPQC